MPFPPWIPIQEPYRMHLLILEMTLIIMLFTMALLFLKYYWTLQDTARGNRMHLAWAALVLSYGLTLVFFLVGDMYTSTAEQRESVLGFSYLIVTSGAFVFIYNTEKLEIIKTRRVFTIIFGIVYCIEAIMMFISLFIPFMAVAQNFTYAFAVPIAGLFLLYFRKINRLLPARAKIYIGIMIAMMLAFVLGFLATTDRVIAMFYIYMDIFPIFLGYYLQMVSLVLMTISFLIIPSWKELEWKDAIHSILVMYSGGIAIFEHEFKKSDAQGNVKSNLVSGVLESIKSLLDSVLTAGTVKMLDHGEKKILLQQGKHVSAAITADKNLESLKILLDAFITEFEKIFIDVLPKWQGDVDVFLPAKAIIEKTFK